MADGASLISSSIARGAYQSSRALKSEAPGPAAEAAQSGAQTFADMLKGATADAVHTVREADAVARAGMAGKADTQQVVEATVALESTVKIAVSMRDKFVQAYQEVLRMPI